MKKIFTKKRVIWGIIILLLLLGIGYFVFGRKNNSGNFQTTAVQRQDLQETVLATGQVVSGTNLSLGFQVSGIVRRVSVKEGNSVYEGQVLASLDQASQLASLTSAQGSLQQAQANYDKLIAGATSQDVLVSQSAVDSAKVTVSNAQQSLLTKIKNAYDSSYSIVANSTSPMFSNPASTNPQLSINEVVFNNQQLLNQINNERVKLVQMLPSWNAKISAATSGDSISSNALSNLSQINFFLTDMISMFGTYSIGSTAAGSANLSASQTTVATSLTANNASITDINTAIQTLNAANSALAQSQASLELKKAPATQAELDAANAQITSAEGQVALAQANLNNLILRAPSSGTITQVNVKVGQQATALQTAVVLQNIKDLHAEANVSEANIASLSPGQSIDYTFDALGPDQHFAGKILTINPASTVISGVVNYLVKGTLDNVPNIKPGMTANMTIMVAKKQNVLALPSTAVITKNSNQYVRVVDDLKNQKYHEVQVKTGLQADGGLVEILSGLSEGQQIVTYIK